MQGQELCESGGGRPGLPVLDSPYGLCGRKATLNLDLNADQFSSVPTQAKTTILVSSQPSAQAMTMALYTFLFSWAPFSHILAGKACFIKRLCGCSFLLKVSLGCFVDLTVINFVRRKLRECGSVWESPPHEESLLKHLRAIMFVNKSSALK